MSLEIVAETKSITVELYGTKPKKIKYTDDETKAMAIQKAIETVLLAYGNNHDPWLFIHGI